MSATPSFFFSAPKRVLLISPQPWDGLKVSKHHYASELALLGHQVWFVEPPVAGGRAGSIAIADTDTPGVRRVSYTPWFPYGLKFHARAVFDLFMRRQARMIARAVGGSLDLVWDFDNAYQFNDLTAFPAALRIFHLFDEMGRKYQGDKSANLLLSVSQDFLDRIRPVRRGHVISHGLSRTHKIHAQSILAPSSSELVRRSRPCVGYVGNLEHPGIDWPTIIRIVEAHPHISFRFVGPYSGDIERGKPDSAPLARLLQLPNVILTGPRPAAAILEMASEIDIWLVCYAPELTVNGATNSHKILEYLATGNAVLANRIAAYQDCDLVEMPSATNEGMLALLSRMLERLDDLNSPAQRQRRAQFALQFSYEANLRRIDEKAVLTSIELRRAQHERLS